ncbi:peptidoglycan DD-metalloendopeptidase family protein [Elusimicrobiota bacterium]
MTGSLSSKPLYIVLEDNGLAEPELSRISLALERIVDPKRLRKGDEYVLTLSTAGAFRSLMVGRGLKRYYVVATGRERRRLVSRIVDIPVRPVKQSAKGTIHGSLWESMISDGISPAIIVTFADIFAWSIDFLTEPRDGDKYALAWTEDRTPDGTVIGRRILAAAYKGKETGLKNAVFFEGGYYDKEGKSLHRFFLRAPLQYRRISSFFSKRRFHPILRIHRPHNGIDYAAPTGTPVSNVADGTVIFAGWKGGYGRYVGIRHRHDYETGYGHLSKIAKNIRPGRRVRQGQVIGYVGKTGLATGPHLDFSIKESGKYVNFLRLKFRSASALNGSRRASFLSSTKELVRDIEQLLEQAGAIVPSR